MKGENRGARMAIVVGFAALAAGLICAAPAGAYVYWGNLDAHAIGRATNDGSIVEPQFIQTSSAPRAVAVDSSHIYWASETDNLIGRAKIDGTGVENEFIGGTLKANGVAVNGSSIFWSSTEGPIGRANLNGSGKNNSFITGVSESCAVALDAGHIYWTDVMLAEAYVGRAPLDGQGPEDHFSSIGAAVPCGLAVNSGSIFWTDTGLFGGGTRIGTANVKTGGGVDPSYIGEAEAPCGIAVHGLGLYWANAEGQAIGHANTDRTGVNQTYFPTGPGVVCGVAVDDLAPPPQVPGGGGGADKTPPQTKIKSGPGKKLAKGRAKFSFSSSEAGSSFACKLDGKKAAGCRSPKSYEGLRPGRHTFKVWATDRAGNKDQTPAKRSFKVPAA